MKKSLKGALLSGLVFPGMGQIVLKRQVRGILFLLATLVCFAVAVVTAVQQTMLILSDIMDTGEMDVPSITRAAVLAVNSGSGTLFAVAFFLLLFCWFASTVDAYLLGRRLDAEARAAQKTS